MTMPERYKTLKGFEDVLPDEEAYWQFVERTATQVAHLYGYRRIETPLLEETSVFHHGVGEGTDIVEKEMYSFEDRADKEGHSTNITLRPEGTAGVVRAYLQNGLFKLPQPVKLFYLGAFFRREKPQAGRFREHHQFGCEALGSSDPAVDAEMIGLLYQFYSTLGLQHIRVAINSIGDSNCRPQYIVRLKEYYQPLLNDCCDDCRMRFQKNPLRLLDCKKPQDQAKIQGAPKISEYLDDACREHFAAVQHYLQLYGVPFTLDPLIVRGLDYYTRTVFEFSSEIDKLALNGGGRYDGLAEILGGATTPGIGFGAGVERIIAEIKKQGITPPVEERALAFVVYSDTTAQLKAAAIQLVADLRHAGFKAEMSYGDRSRKAQMKQANASGASYAIIIREDESSQLVFAVKDLQAEGMDLDAKQVDVPREQVIEYLLGKQPIHMG